MNIRYIILEQILNEGRFEEVVNKYGNVLDVTRIRLLAQSDPSGNNKYLGWMTKSVVDGEDDEVVKNNIICFHKNLNALNSNVIDKIYTEVSPDQKGVLEKIKKSPKDINSYPSSDWLVPICEFFEQEKSSVIERVKIWSDGRWEIISPLTHKASCKYGIHSNWCVSTSNPDFFNRYTKDGVLIFWLDKKELHPTRSQEVGHYKIAVYIKFINFDKPEKWLWFSMEDNPLEASFMLTILPKGGIDACKKYASEIYQNKNTELLKFFDTIHPYTMGIIKVDNEYLFFPNMVDGVIPEKTILFFDNVPSSVYGIKTMGDYLRKYQSGQEFGVPFFTFKIEDFTDLSNIMDDFRYNDISWHYLNKIESNNVIKKSDIINKVNTDLDTAGLTDDAKKQIVYKLVKDFYNIVGTNTRRTQVRSTSLNLGDNIEYKEKGSRRWAKGDVVQVVKISPKTITLSNGKKITRSETNWKYLISPPIRFVDDTINEQKWIRKRII